MREKQRIKDRKKSYIDMHIQQKREIQIKEE